MTTLEGPRQPDNEEYAVMLPCSQDDFKDFISGLLGKSQTIEQMLWGPFEVNVRDIENFYHLVDQRVTQQNEASLIQFTVRIVYDDNSSVLLNSLDDFLHYHEVRPIVSTRVHLSWTFLVRFQDKTFPEKQQIDVSIVTDPEGFAFPVPVAFFSGGSVGKPIGGFISFRVSHTARTWGADMEALLTGHVKNLMKELGKVRKFVYSHSDAVGLWVALLFFLGAIGGSFFATHLFSNAQTNAAQSMSEQIVAGISTEKETLLINYISKGAWHRFFFYQSSFVFIAIIIAIALGVWATTSAETRAPSFLLLSAQADRHKQKLLDSTRKKWLSFLFSIFAAIMINIVANIVFALLVLHWTP